MSDIFLHDCLRRYARSSPEKSAVISAESQLSYRELYERIVSFAAYLKKNLPPQSVVGIVKENTPDALIAYYAIPFAGMVGVPVDANIHENNLKALADRCNFKLIVTSTRISSRFKTLSTPLLRELEFGTAADAGLGEHLKPHDTALMFFTTGTTGLSKGVELSHTNLLASARNINQFIGTDETAVEVMPMPISHSFGFGRIRCVFGVGGTVLLEKGLLRADHVIANMEKYRATGFSCVPAGIEIMLTSFKDLFSKVSGSLRYIELGSSSMSCERRLTLMELCPNARICMHYGLTEASRSTFIEFHSTPREFLETIGRASPNVEIKLLDKEGREVGIGEAGELVIRGEMVMKGYFKDPERTASALRNGYLHTGDLAMRNAEGFLSYIGREDEVINYGGFKISPFEIETALLKFPNVKDAAAIGVRSRTTGLTTLIKAFVVPKDDSVAIDSSEIRRHCLSDLEAYKIPGEIEVVRDLPKTESGKLKRLELREIR